jgi:hypothetical protein
LCTSFYREGENECISFCDSYTVGEACLGQQGCLTGLLSGGFSEVGLCAGECDAFGGEGCPEGNSCIFGTVGAGGARVEQVIGFCAENSNQGDIQTGEVCEPTVDASGESNGTSNCAPGHLCATTAENQPPTCLQLCQDDNVLCGEGTSCQKVFDPEFVATVGICL